MVDMWRIIKKEKIVKRNRPRDYNNDEISIQRFKIAIINMPKDLKENTTSIIMI